ncbi:TadE/TadG family type IV pilus assembly protein [Oryzifoliimicrobium ureilyticus]|uniref:TadE/TadG family type IV pilus assembly protein n=1 Tax=Oryzifoliimicrobium ureilyticus TaxID=3113724 RepID=UPI0030767A1F
MRLFLRSSDGAAAIEFALLAIPYFMVIFAILETFVAFAGEQLVYSAVDTLSRKIRTGQITYNMGRTTDMNTVGQFRQAVCDEISILIKCSSSEVSAPAKLYVDVQTFTSFANIPTAIPRVSSAAFADLDPSKMKYAFGGPGTINMVRVYYRWQIITDIIRPYVTTIRPADGSMPRDFLIVGTAAFQNEHYP